MSETILTVEGLYKKFHDAIVLSDVSLSLSAGEVLSVIGPSGSGKSTLLRCLNQLELIDAGEVRFKGEVQGVHRVKGKLFRMPERTVVRQRRRFGMVFQHFNLFPHMTAVENVMEGPVQVAGMVKAAARELALEQLRSVGLSDRADHYPSELSGGQQQRVAIARALALSPEVMLLDEPTSALDPELVGEVLDVIRGLAERGMTMVIVTHEMSLAREISDRVAVMDQGRLIEVGTPQHIFSSASSPRTQRFISKLINQADSTAESKEKQ